LVGNIIGAIATNKSEIMLTGTHFNPSLTLSRKAFYTHTDNDHVSVVIYNFKPKGEGGSILD
tara:strand:- start:28 stop:213 length:186 start_codon:yes stop_codon:yes gene_type:complete